MIWILGVIIYLLMMATAFMGYVLPWGQMSFWGATVITNIIGSLPVIGGAITTWLWGGFAVDDPTLNRFFSLHYLLPFMIAGVVVLHVWALHVPGNNNPLGVNVKSDKDTIPFHPYYTVKDGFGIAVFVILFATFVFFNPDGLGHPDNYIAANPLVTPPHIVPEWYFLPFYAILRAIPNKLAGCWPCSPPSASCSCSPGSTPPRCARCATGRRRGSTSASSWSPASCLGFCGAHEPDEQVIPGLASFTLFDSTSTATSGCRGSGRRATSATSCW